MASISLIDLFREERIQGKVIDKYKQENGNIGIILENQITGKRYSVEFRTEYVQPGWENLYRIVKEPFKGKKQYIDHLVEKNTYVDLTASYSKGPVRYAYSLHAVSSKPLYSVKRLPQRYKQLSYQPY